MKLIGQFYNYFLEKQVCGLRKAQYKISATIVSVLNIFVFSAQSCDNLRRIYRAEGVRGWCVQTIWYFLKYSETEKKFWWGKDSWFIQWPPCVTRHPLCFQLAQVVLQGATHPSVYIPPVSTVCCCSQSSWRCSSAPTKVCYSSATRCKLLVSF